jgi:oligopeptide/dipeptide ABC transporter ATP-binding protein
MTALLEVRDLQVEFDTQDGRVRVLDHVSFDLAPGEILGIVGESGCGKSMTALSILGLVPKPTGHVTAGQIQFQGEDLLRVPERRMREVRGNDISMIFQEPMTSLNPVYRVGEQIAETLRFHRGLGRATAEQKAVEMLKAVRIPDAERRAREFPHQFSGGMRQRVMIAIAIACQPKILIADEPTTALDVTVQAQIFDLLLDLREKNGTATILITHDMGAVGEMADRVIVMYAGRKVEEGPVDAVLSAPAHPYTKGLLASRPHLEIGRSGPRQPLLEIPGIVPPLHLLGAGCAFADRCPIADEQCRKARPAEEVVGDGHTAACWKSGARASRAMEAS